MKIGVLTITRGDRPEFVDHCVGQMKRQSVGPTIHEIMDDKPLTEGVDITYRYRIGTQRLFDKGCDVVLFCEDDDYYSRKYVELMMRSWLANGRPHVFGLNKTIYYNIRNSKFANLTHPGRASMMSTMVSKHAVINWGDDNYAYTDMILWQQSKSKLAVDLGPICVGIKHGVGLCGGGGHDVNWIRFHGHDENHVYLKSLIDEKSYNFYSKWFTK